MFIALALAACTVLADTPVEFGRSELDREFQAAGLQSPAADVDVRVSPGGAPESYRIHPEGRRILVQGADPAGAMYGALELGERVRMQGASGLASLDITGSPFLRDRGLNVFLTLPWDYEKNSTDYDPAALTDPQRWWFASDDYWRTLLDLMARSRLNWLDMHGTWDISVTDAPNLYAYFIQCPSFPEVGVKPQIKAANLARLNKIIDMAHARGIRVSLMAYEAKLRIPQNPSPPYPRDEKTAYAYTHEAVEGMIRGAPGLDAIGFRIGESGFGGEFFNCYTEAVKNSGRQIPLYTRSWVTRRAKVLPLAAASQDFTVEIKYNGEQWGPPYQIAGGRVAGWYSYSFEDYFSDPGRGPFARLWPGNEVSTSSGTAAWPSEPYKIVWQVRLNGTHRIFPFNDPEWVRRSIQCMRQGTASGYTVEPINAYFPASPGYYLADPKDRWCDWMHQRDDLFIMSWGRLGYDPQTPAEVFRAPLKARFGSHADQIAAAWQAASRVIPTAFSAYSLGPDHRNHAPELEWGGDTSAFIDREPFDSHVFMSVKEMTALRSMEGQDGRLTPLDAAELLHGLANQCDLSKVPVEDIPLPSRGQFHELRQSTAMLAHLAEYYASRFLAAEALSRSANPLAPHDEALKETGYYTSAALEAWRGLSDSPEARFYRPFTDRLRMGTNDFHWKNELPKMEEEAKRFPATPGFEPTRFMHDHPALAEPLLSWTSNGDQVVCTVTGNQVDLAWLLYKPLPSSTFFHKIPMKRHEDFGIVTYQASIDRLPAGHAIAAEIKFGDHIRRIPSWDPGPPYLIVPSRPGPTPTYYSSEEALTYLRPEVLSPDRYSMLLMCTRAWSSHRSFNVPTQRKLLTAVEHGLQLLVLQQDYASGRYPLRWLGPDSPVVRGEPTDDFDPLGTLGLPKFHAEGILWQPFAAAPGWDVFGNGGIAHANRGKGGIWMVQARLMQTMSVPESAQAIRTLLSMGDKSKPVVIIDAGTEGADMATSVFPDLLNAIGIPFLTLGEVIAAEQGADCLTPIPGPIQPDGVLEGRGGAMVSALVKSKVKAAAHLAVPPSIPDFDRRKDRQRKDLMRGLGLDPLPERTPLNARTTGTLQRDGYRVEKLVFESRPNFPVTALVYVPDAPAGTKFPVIVNPHGHWPHKKSEPVVQMRAISQALHGYLAIVIDTPGHSFEGDTPIERRWAGTHDDFALTMGVGNTTGVYVWDLMRAVDYLQTRPDADTSRIGITGASGGGLATVFAFAADERFTAAVPVCYATSMEVNPSNGCLCNHVPGSLRIGDRADILAIRAPAPVMVIGATDDVEFPPEGTRLTGEKLKALYAVLNAADNTAWQLFKSGHDYNKPMREAALGFFDRHLKGAASAEPVPEPNITPEPADSPELVCLPSPPADLRTMRDLVTERLEKAVRKPFEEVARLNGGLPEACPLNARVIEGPTSDPQTRFFAFDSEMGLTIPGLAVIPKGTIRAAAVLVCDEGKAQALRRFNVEALTSAGIACFCIDPRGLGEMAGLDERLMAYLGTSPVFAMGWDTARAVHAARELSTALGIPAQLPTGIAGRGACSAQAAMFAALIDPAPVSFVAGLDGLRDYVDILKRPVDPLAIQFFAADAAPLGHLRSLVGCPTRWHFADDPAPDAASIIKKLALPRF